MISMKIIVQDIYDNSHLYSEERVSSARPSNVEQIPTPNLFCFSLFSVFVQGVTALLNRAATASCSISRISDHFNLAVMRNKSSTSKKLD
jgi:hypothetical protein